MKKIISKIVLASVFSVTCSSVMAVSYDSWHTAQRYFNAGVSTDTMVTHADHMCYLSRSIGAEADTTAEESGCNVVRSGNYWLLQAYIDNDGDAQVRCAAYCYNL